MTHFDTSYWAMTKVRVSMRLSERPIQLMRPTA